MKPDAALITPHGNNNGKSNGEAASIFSKQPPILPMLPDDYHGMHGYSSSNPFIIDDNDGLYYDDKNSLKVNQSRDINDKVTCVKQQLLKEVTSKNSSVSNEDKLEMKKLYQQFNAAQCNEVLVNTIKDYDKITKEFHSQEAMEALVELNKGMY